MELLCGLLLCRRGYSQRFAGYSTMMTPISTDQNTNFLLAGKSATSVFIVSPLISGKNPLPLPGRFVQNYGCGNAGIERLDSRRMGNCNQLVCLGEYIRRQARALIADQHGNGAGEINLIQRLAFMRR